MFVEKLEQVLAADARWATNKRDSAACVPANIRPLALPLRAMEHVAFARRLLVVLFLITILAFWLEAAWDFAHAVDPTTGQPLHLRDLRATPAMVRSLASAFGGAYATMLALLLTFISLAIPITANLYTPKLIEIFIHDPINLFVICTCAILAAHNLLAVSLSFDAWTAQLPFAIAVAGAIIGWLLLLPYYFYVVSFIDPLTIIQRVHRSLMRELDAAAAGRYPIAVSQQRVYQKIHNLGSVLLRASDRGDRDVTLDAVRTHLLEVARLREVKPRLPSGFLQIDNDLLAGMSGDAAEMLSRARNWPEHQVASQLVFAFKRVLVTMPDGTSAMAQAVKNTAHAEAVAGNDEVFRLLLRVLNSFTREAIKKKDNAAACGVIYAYKALARRLLADHPQYVPPMVHHLCFYAEFARAQSGMNFTYERVSYELAELAERAHLRGVAAAAVLLDALLSLEGVEHSTGLVKSRAFLAGYFRERGTTAELDRIVESLRTVPRETLGRARREIVSVQDRAFWELNERGVDFDYLEPTRREQVMAVLDAADALH